MIDTSLLADTICYYRNSSKKEIETYLNVRIREMIQEVLDNPKSQGLSLDDANDREQLIKLLMEK